MISLIKNISLIFIIFVLIIFKIANFFIKIKFSTVQFSRIGGVYHLDWQLSKKKKLDINIIYIFLYSDKNNIANKYWRDLWKKQVQIIKVPHFIIFIINNLKKYSFFDDVLLKRQPVNIIGKKLHLFQKNKSNNLIRNNDIFLKHILSNRDPNIEINHNDMIKGERLLNKIGIRNNSKIVCIHNRDSAYLKSVNDQINWDYHNYRDFNIKDYELTVFELIKRGYTVVRIGSITEGIININNLNYIDYSNSQFRSDFLDIFLLKKCEFFISSDSGISAIAEILRKPIVYVNKSLHWENHRWVFEAIVIYKKFYSKKMQRLLTFEECYNLRIGSTDTNDVLKEQCIEIQNNTPEEILNAVIEMEEYLKNKIFYNDEDNNLQSRYWNIFKPNDLRSKNFRLGRHYLQNYKILL